MLVLCGRWVTGRRIAGRCRRGGLMGRRRLVEARQRAGEYIAGRTLFDGPRENSSRTRQLGLTGCEA